MKRLFIAIPSSVTIQEIIGEIEHEWKKRADGTVKWVNPEHAHLTLHFLGDVNGEAIPEIITVLKESTAKVRPFLLALGGLGAFPQPWSAKVLYINAEEVKSHILNSLHKKIGEGLKALGFTIDNRPFVPHITLGRLRQERKLTTEWYVTRPAAWSIDSINLMESRLYNAGPVYSIVESLPLKQQ